MAKRAADVLGLDCTGVDVVTDESTGKSYVLEANMRPAVTFHMPDAEDVKAHLTAVYTYADRLSRATIHAAGITLGSVSA